MSVDFVPRSRTWASPSQICETVIAIHYPENTVKGGITNGSQRPIIAASPEERGRVKLAQRQDREDKDKGTRTMRVKFTILIFRCLLTVRLIRLHGGDAVAMGAVLAAGNPL